MDTTVRRATRHSEVILMPNSNSTLSTAILEFEQYKTLRIEFLYFEDAVTLYQIRKHALSHYFV